MKHTDREWLETDGLGGFASGTISGRRTRRYHALLLSSSPQSEDRFVLVNGLETYVQTPRGVTALSSQRYVPNVIHPHGDRHIHDFQAVPWPSWEYRIDDQTRIRQEIFVPRNFSAVILRWTLVSPSSEKTTLTVRPLLSGRNYHALHQENASFNFEHTGIGSRLEWHPYNGIPGIIASTNGAYHANPLWYRHFLYTHEAERGLDSVEDLASPGLLHFDLEQAPALCVFSAKSPQPLMAEAGESVEHLVNRIERMERDRRSRFSTRLHRSADQFLVKRGERRTIIAGYPWFTDWGRDTFIALRGLCLTTGRFDDAERILDDWSGTLSQGMVPNRFPDGNSEPEYNSVDASLWYIIAIHSYFESMKKAALQVPSGVQKRLLASMNTILSGYAAGTRYQIKATEDGLLQAGEPGVQLTWMDAKVGDWVVTPRIGKPVEIQALWINALSIGSQFDPQWQDLLKRAQKSFQERFWNQDQSCLFDVIDVDHRPGEVDGSVRPNQLLAIGGLPLMLLEKTQARKLLATVEEQLLTPLGMRTLTPQDSRYQPHYTGGILARDGAYHQGTAWPWLLGPFVEAWLRVYGDSAGNRSIARARFVQPVVDHLESAGLGHVSEIADGAPTLTPQGERQIPRGCPFQAWSLSELLRILDDSLAAT